MCEVKCNNRPHPTSSPEYHWSCYTCLRSIWPCVRQKVLPNSKSWAKFWAYLANIMILHWRYGVSEEQVLRWIMVLQVLSLDDRLDNIGRDSAMSLRVEVIPEDQMQLSPEDVSEHVYHFRIEGRAVRLLPSHA